MTTYRLQHAFQARSGDSKDMYVNTFHFIGTPADEPVALDQLATAVKGFYGAIAPGASQAIIGFMSNFAMGPGRSIKVYDLSDPVDSENGITRPTHYSSLDFAQVRSSDAQPPLPEEVAVCLSFEGLSIPGGNRARRRGRLYLGPFNVTALDNGNLNAQCFIKIDLANVIVAAASALMSQALAAGFTWVIHSPTDNADITLGRVWVDNAFDTVRGRGKPSTARVVQAGAPFDEP